MQGRLDKTGTRLSNASPIIIQDIIIEAAGPLNADLYGEYLQQGLPIETVAQSHERLFKQIELLTADAAAQHKRDNFNGSQLAAGKENNVTRLLTNEFFFYTKDALTLKEFEALQQKIMDMATKYPENLHLILGTFAVRDSNEKLMNVAVHIECGPSPQLHLVVKNYPSPIDPIYIIEHANGYGSPLLNANLAEDVDTIPKEKISIDGKDQYFTFNGVLTTKTAGNASFYTCIEICLDHDYETANKYLSENVAQAVSAGSAQKEDLPLSLSHVVLSNRISLIPYKCLGTVAHANPSYTEVPTRVNQVEFGTDYTITRHPGRQTDPLPTAQEVLVGGFNQARAMQAQATAASASSTSSSASTSAAIPLDPKLTEAEKNLLKTAKMEKGFNFENYAKALYKVYLMEPTLVEKLFSKLSRENREQACGYLNVEMDKKTTPPRSKTAYANWLNNRGEAAYFLDSVIISRKELNNKIDSFNQYVDKKNKANPQNTNADFKSTVKAQRDNNAQDDDNSSSFNPH